MRKFTFFLALMVAMVTTTMAQTLDFTFTKVSASEATVAVTGNGVEAGGITATIASNYAWKSLTANSSAYPNATIVCPDRNTSTMNAGNEGIITLTLNNVPENYSFKNVTFTSVALNGGGAFQGDDVNAQQVNFTLTKGETTLGTVENVAIKVNSSPNDYNGIKDQSVTVPFEVAEAYTAENGTLELKLKLSVTESKGCFYGLIKVAIETEVAATPEPDPVTFDIYALDDNMNPSPLEGTVNKLGFVVFAASDKNAVLAEAADAPKVGIFSPAMGGFVAEASGIMFGDLLGNGMQLVAVQFDGFATPGTYMVYAPAGAFTVNGQPSEEIISAEFTIPAPTVKVFEVESVTPANGAEVEAINKIEIKFTEDIILQQNPATWDFYTVNLVDENNKVIELTTSDDANIWSKAVFTPAEPITAAGTYTLDLSQIKLDGGVCEGSYTWTIAEPAPTPSGPPLIALPTIVKIPVPTTAPIPMTIKSKTFNVFFKSDFVLVEINSSALLIFVIFCQNLTNCCFIYFFLGYFFNIIFILQTLCHYFSIFSISIRQINSNTQHQP